MKKTNIKILISVVAVLMCAVMLIACVPQSVEKAQKKMEEAGYVVVSSSDDDKEEGVVGSFIATKTTNIINIDVVTAVWYSSTKEAKEAYEEYKGEEEDEDTVVKRSGKCVYFGTEQAVKDFEG